MSIQHMPGTDLRLPLTPTLPSLLAGHTDHLILKAYAGHHQTIRQVPPEEWGAEPDPDQHLKIAPHRRHTAWS